MDKESVRRFCEQYNIPLISKETEDFLIQQIHLYKPASLAEIGSAIWYSTTIIANTVSSYNKYGRVDSREISYPHYWQALLTIEKYASNTTIYLGNVCHIAREKYTTQQYDMVFIDGRKSETLLYLKKLRHNIHENTLIIVDDVIKFKNKMTDRYEFLDKYDIKYQIHQLENDDGIITLVVTQSLIQALSSL